ncbi:hypothetical protein LTR22_027819 [Elasticomyces elasticus]|nr:hypothetical protein LTR22_027819 [Elasticomyces elasticus]
MIGVYFDSKGRADGAGASPYIPHPSITRYAPPCVPSELKWLSVLPANNRATLERPETLPEPSSNVPFRLDRHFLERAALTDRIRAKLSVPAGRAALVGLGGVGKSQLAIEYARQLRQHSPQTWVLWIHVSNVARFEQGVRDVADQLKIYGRKDPKADLLQLLRNRLRDEGKGRWLIVLDNADDASFLLERPPAPPGEAQLLRRRIDSIPSCDHGSMITTTRSKREARKLVDESEIVEVKPMSEDEAEALLERKLGRPSPDNRHLARALDCIPLAISQAAAYIRKNSPWCSVRQYHEEMERGRQSSTRLLRRHISLADRDDQASNSVFLTWQISFEHIYQARTSAAELLVLMSFFDRHGIPESLLLGQRETETGLGDQNTSTRYGDDGSGVDSNTDILDDMDDSESFSVSRGKLEDDIEMLQDYMFISTSDERSHEMHRLVQLATKDWLDRTDNFRAVEFLERALSALTVAFPEPWVGEWNTYAACLPHARALLSNRRTRDVNGGLCAKLLHKTAWYLLARGFDDDAARMELEALELRISQFGVEHEATLQSRRQLGEIYSSQMLWDAADCQLDQSVRLSTKSGFDELRLESIRSLAESQLARGKYENAERQFRIVADISFRGQDGSQRCRALFDLAKVLQAQGKDADAEPYAFLALHISTRLSGSDSFTSLENKGLYAEISGQSGCLSLAETLAQEVVDGFDYLSTVSPLSTSSVCTLDAVRRLGGIQEEGGNYFRAAATYRRLATAYQNYHNKGAVSDWELEEAEECLSRVLGKYSA